jgi:hypothetical protein
LGAAEPEIAPGDRCRHGHHCRRRRKFEQAVHLRELGVRAAQGYVFAPPLPSAAFIQLIEAIDPLKSVDRTPDTAADILVQSSFNAA